MDTDANRITLAHINSKSAPTVFHSKKLVFVTVICGNKLVTSRLQATFYKHIYNYLVKCIGLHFNPTIDLHIVKLH